MRRRLGRQVRRVRAAAGHFGDEALWADRVAAEGEGPWVVACGEVSNVWAAACRFGKRAGREWLQWGWLHPALHPPATRPKAPTQFACTRFSACLPPTSPTPTPPSPLSHPSTPLSHPLLVPLVHPPPTHPATPHPPDTWPTAPPLITCTRPSRCPSQ